MDEALKQFSKQLALDLKAKFASQPIADFVKQTKDDASDDRTFEVVFSTADEDRQGDSLDQSMWDLKYFNLNPVVLWAHNYSSFPIGIITDIKTQGDKSVATGKFAPKGINPDADMACSLYQEKILRAVSPGYIQNDDGTRELLEVSFCPVPAGRYALSLRQVGILGVSTGDLVTKGFFYETKGAVPYHDYGTADEDTAWDGPAEVKECGDDIEKLKKICAWFDSENADVKSSYKLPHHRASDLKAVWKGVSAAGAALSGARGGVSIPDKDVAAVKAHLAKHYAAFGKTPPWEEKSEKSPEIGDTCQLDDETPGVLADDPKNPGEMVCVPEKNKSEDSDMNNELIKNLKAEHDRHQKSVGKAIDEFEKKAVSDEEGATEGKSEANDNSEYEKSIEEFKDAIDGEHADHLEKCMKAIDDTYETMGREPNKSIDEFKSVIKAEHLKHVKAFDKAHSEMKKAWPDDGEDGAKDKRKKAIDEYTKSASDELDRHEKAHMDMCKDEFGEGEEDGKEGKEGKKEKKGVVEDEFMQGAEDREKNERMNYVMTVMYAFCNAYCESPVESFFELIAEAIELIQAYAKNEQEESDAEEEAEGHEDKKYSGLVAKYVQEGRTKSGRAISAANQDKLKAIIKALEDHHTEHGKAIDEITAALKAISASGDGGEEPKTDEKSVTAPNSRSSTSGANSELETYLFTQRLVRQVKTASEGALRQINEKIKKVHSSNS
jgi:hypothetical protein